MTARKPTASGPTEQARRERVYCDRPGLFAVKMAKDGVDVALRVQHEATPDPETGEPGDRSPIWTFTLNGKIVWQDMMTSPKLWLGREITASEYEWLLKDRAWAVQYAKHLPEAMPTKAADPRKIAPVLP